MAVKSPVSGVLGTGSGLLLAVVVLCMPTSSQAEESRTPVDQQRSSLIIFRTMAGLDGPAARHSLEQLGARILVSVPPWVFLARLPTEAEEELAAREEVIVASMDRALDADRIQLEFGGRLNWVAGFWEEYRGRKAVSRKTGPMSQGPPLVDDIRPGLAESPVELDVRRPRFLPTPLVDAPLNGRARPDTRYSGISRAAGEMSGNVAVLAILVESNGTIDPDLEDWTVALEDEVLNEIFAGLVWWVDQATLFGQTLSVTLYWYRPSEHPQVVNTGYEPISRSSLDECKWIGLIMKNLGFFDECFSAVASVNQYLIDEEGADDAFSVFVVNSTNDPDDSFTNGYFAYAYFGGPFFVMTTGNGGWGLPYMNVVAAHETGHIFRALDEYCQPGYYCCDCNDSSYGCDNDNCENGCETNYACIMRHSESELCPSTRCHIGWGCTPDCTWKECGSDGCGGSCGQCPYGESCNANGFCVASGACGPAGSNSCMGLCGLQSGSCYCDPSCVGYGDCCADYYDCCVGCIPNCVGKICGDDGCGGSCGTCVDGQDPCIGNLCANGSCVPTPLTGGACDDSDLCTQTDVCIDGLCTGLAPVVCPPLNECQEQGSCVAFTGLCEYPPRPDGIPCDDGSVCTVDDECASGECVGTDTSGVVCDDGELCTDDGCDPLTGCTNVNNTVPCAAAMCEGLLFYPVALCAEGACPEQVAQDCDDGELCTDDSCDPDLGCVHVNNELECAAAACDGSTWRAAAFCAGGACPEQAEESCLDENPCTNDLCDPVGGCTHEENLGFCVVPHCVGLVWHGSSSCVDGVCPPEPQSSCDDDNVCTDDTCDAVTGCGHTNNILPCTEARCEGLVHYAQANCLEGACPEQEVTFCDDGNHCTDDQCDPALGCVNTPNPAVTCYPPFCDGTKFHDTTYCALDGTCPEPVVTQDCDDQDVCTDDFCHPAEGCTSTLNAAPCTEPSCDGLTWYPAAICVQGDCPQATGYSCDDGNVCTDDSCIPEVGCVNQNNTSPCGMASCDGATWHPAPLCVGGTCHPQASVTCDDNNACTVDSCDVANGCRYEADTTVVCHVSRCEDLSWYAAVKCTDQGTCPDQALVEDCDDGNVCTDDSCDPAEGCQHLDNDEPCAEAVCDGLTWYPGAVCAGGACPDPAGVSCDDGDGCTTDQCTSEAGCANPYVPDDCAGRVCGASPGGCHECGTCPDGFGCDAEGQCYDLCDDVECPECQACFQGTCVQANEGGACTDDGNDCTGDACLTGQCTHAPLDDGTPCDDGDACTLLDLCGAGLCQGTNVVACGGEDPCNEAGVCDPTTGICVVTPKPDGTTCDDAEPCTSGDSCESGACGGLAYQCPEPAQCEAEVSCDGAGDCDTTFRDPGIPCDDGQDCTFDDLCDGAGTCAGTGYDCVPGQCEESSTCDGSGECGVVLVAAGSPCDDDDPCTEDDQCDVDGLCAGIPGRACLPDITGEPTEAAEDVPEVVEDLADRVEVMEEEPMDLSTMPENDTSTPVADDDGKSGGGSCSGGASSGTGPTAVLLGLCFLAVLSRRRFLRGVHVTAPLLAVCLILGGAGCGSGGGDGVDLVSIDTPGGTDQGWTDGGADGFHDTGDDVDAAGDEGGADTDVTLVDPGPDAMDCQDDDECVVAFPDLGPCESAICQAGKCVRLPVECGAAPPDVCIDDYTLKEHSGDGTCDPVSGECVYEWAPVNCPAGCLTNVCAADLGLIQAGLTPAGPLTLSSAMYGLSSVMPGWHGSATLGSAVFRLDAGFEP